MENINDDNCCNGNNVKEISKKMPDEQVFYKLSELFKIFGDSTRLKILYVLFKREMCVQHIADVLGMTQSAVSHQLRVLKSSKLVKFRKDGRTTFYSLDDNHVETMFEQGLEHINH